MGTLKVIGSALYQWEIGRKIRVLSSVGDRAVMVQFAHPGDKEALSVTPREENGVIVADVPNILLQSGDKIIAFLVEVDANCVETTKHSVFHVVNRPKPADYIYTETEVLNYKYLDDRLNQLEGDGLANAVADYLKENPVEAGATKEEAEQIAKNKVDIETLNREKLDASKLPEAVNDALAQAKVSGEFKGEKGDPGQPGQPGEQGPAGPAGADGQPGEKGEKGDKGDKGDTGPEGPQGEKGEPGEKGADGQPGADGKDGKDGQDGYTPQKGVDYFDGQDGKDGVDGKDGYTPQKGIDYFDGKDGKDGKNGQNGSDGVSATHSWNGTVLTITSASGTSSADLKGADGKDGQNGSDYVLTEADKNEIAEIAADLVDVPSGGSGIDVTAAVGQTIVVKEVDSNGKPTKWEAVEYQPRTHGVEIAELLPNTSAVFVEEEEEGFFMVEANFELVEGLTYTVNWNGAPYSCVAAYADGAYALGNLDMMQGTGDSGEPFLCAVTDGIMMILPLDGSEEVVIGVSGETIQTINKNYLPNDVLYGVKGYTSGAFDLEKWAWYEAGVSNLTGNTNGFEEVPFSREQFEMLEEVFKSQIVYLQSADQFVRASRNGDAWQMQWINIVLSTGNLSVGSMTMVLQWSEEHECVQRSCTIEQSVHIKV